MCFFHPVRHWIFIHPDVPLFNQKPPLESTEDSVFLPGMRLDVVFRQGSTKMQQAGPSSIFPTIAAA
jgi:hypothetical protein